MQGYVSFKSSHKLTFQYYGDIVYLETRGRGCVRLGRYPLTQTLTHGHGVSVGLYLYSVPHLQYYSN